MIKVFSNRKNKPQAYPFLAPSKVGIGGIKYLHTDPIEFAISTDDGKTWLSCYDVPDLQDIYCFQAPDVQPATQTDNLRKVAMQDGQRLLSSSYDQRTFTMHVISDEDVSEPDTQLGYDALQRFLVSRQAYWICFANWPQRMYYVRAKMGTPTFYADRAWSADVTFTDLIGLSRSIGTSLDYVDHVLGFGNNEPLGGATYSFSSNSFTVYNPSDVDIDPYRRGHQLVITLNGSSNGDLKMVNQTNGTMLERSGAVTNTSSGQTQQKSNFSGTFKIDGVRPTLNGKSDEINCTDNEFHLAKGNNTIQISNFSGSVSFDFPFWWLS